MATSDSHWDRVVLVAHQSGLPTAPLTISILFSTIWDIFGQSDYLIQLEILLPTYLFKYELFYALIISLAHIWFLGNYEC